MKLKIAVFAGVLALMASSAFAGQWIAVKGGGTFPMSDLKDVAGTGYNGGIVYGYGLGNNMAVGADVTYNGFGKKTITVDTGSGTVSTDIKPKVYSYTAQGWYMFPMKGQKGMPYVTVGVGGYTFDSGVSGASSKTKFGANGGVGYNYMVNDMTSVGLDVGYHWISTGSDFKKADGSNATASMVTAGVHVGWSLGGGAKKK